MMMDHEVKGAALAVGENVIAPAFGSGRCPKLVGQVRSARTQLRVNALAVLIDELRNPLSVVGCVAAGVVPVLNAQSAAGEDAVTRRRASRALEVCSRDANGAAAMLDDGTPAAIAKALDDAEEDVRRNAYHALLGVSTGNRRGVRALIDANYAAVLVAKAARESAPLKPAALRLLRNCLSDDEGLHQALEHSAVETCIGLLADDATAVRKEAAVTLTALCFAEMAKMIAIEQDAVPALVRLLKDPDDAVQAAAAGALMAVTTTDEGKRAMVPANAVDGVEAVDLLVGLLRAKAADVTLAANCLKCIANVAVHPKARLQMRGDPDCLGVLDDLCQSRTHLVAKHASIAKQAVLWEP